MILRILCCGDREWTDEEKVRNALVEFHERSAVIVIHGGCRGADQISGKIAKSLGYKVVEYPADWASYGKAAGPIRNKAMLDDGNPHLVLAFHSNIGMNKGTKNMIQQAKKKGVEVRIIN